MRIPKYCVLKPHRLSTNSMNFKFWECLQLVDFSTVSFFATERDLTLTNYSSLTFANWINIYAFQENIVIFIFIFTLKKIQWSITSTKSSLVLQYKHYRNRLNSLFLPWLAPLQLFFSHFLERQDTTTPYLPPMACAWVMGVGNTFVWFNYCRISSDWDWALSLPDMHHDPCIMYCLAYLMH